jgi:site-specific DNA-methyltransferase (adenine-specific)
MGITETVARNTIHEADIFDLCGRMGDQSVDMILADLPYGTTACSWDTVIPFEPMWTAFRRIIKPRGAIVLTASQPFTSALVMSNPRIFRYEWIWQKDQGRNFQLASFQPLKITESVLIFSKESARYFPQGVIAVSICKTNRSKGGNLNHLASETVRNKYMQTIANYPTNVIRVTSERGLHPTQKPVALFEYLIRTYTQPGELVFDPTAGSGTTAVAARQTGRHYIVGDSSAEYVAIMRERLGKPYTLPMMELEQACLSANA